MHCCNNIEPDKKQLKILLVSDMYYPLAGGIPEHVFNLYKNLKEKGHIVHILTGKPIRGKTENNPDIKRHGYYISVPANKSFSQITVGLTLWQDLKVLFEKEQYDIIHIHGTLAPTLPILSLLYSNSTNIATFHASHKRSMAYSALRSPLSKVYRRIHGLIAVSKEAERSIKMYFGGDFTIIPNGIDLKRFTPEGEKIEKYNDGKFNILFLGRHDPRKGVKYIYKAMDLLIDKYTNIRLIVVGKGVLKNYYKMLISDKSKNHIFIEDKVENKDIPKYYRTADLFVSPATGGESFGIVLLEAMASGTPIVASRIRGYRQVAKHKNNIFFVKPKDVIELAEGIEQMIENEKMRNNIKNNALEYVRDFSWNEVTNRVIDFYRQTMEKRLRTL